MLSIMSPVVKFALAAGESGDRAHHRHIPEPLGQDQADIGAFDVLFFGSRGTDPHSGSWRRDPCFDMPIESAQRDALHIGLFDVLTLNALEYLGIHLQMAVYIVGRDRAATFALRAKAVPLHRWKCPLWSI